MELFKVKKAFARKRGFSLVELLVVITIVGILGAVSFVAIQRTKMRSMNERMLDDLIAIANSLEDYRRDHQGNFPDPSSALAESQNQNVLCFYADATYADCDDANRSFVQGMIDNDLLTKRYLREVPTDPRTGSRYAYGVSKDGKYYEVSGIYEDDDGYEARTVGNLAKGFELPSLIRAWDGPNFVIDGEGNLPYSPDRLTLTGRLANVVSPVDSPVAVNPGNRPAADGMVVRQGDTILSGAGSADVYLSDGSVVHIDPTSEVELKSLLTDKNDSRGTITKILLKLNLGKIWSKVARLASASEFRVETTGAIAGVRGTEFGIDKDGDVRVKAGKVWKDAVPALSAAELLGRPAPASDIAPNAAVSDWQGYYSSIPLTANNRPHILSVAPIANSGEHAVKIRNVNYFADQVSRSLEAQATLSSGTLSRTVRVTRLAFYDAAAVAANPATAKALASPAPLDLLANPSGPYEIAIPPTVTAPLAMRFEHLDPLTQKILSSSSFAPVPALTPGTTLTEAQLHPNLAPGPDEFAILAPDVSPAGAPFTATIVLPAGANLDGSISAAGCAISVSGANFVVTPAPPAASATPADCVLSATATLSNGTAAQATKTVRIVSATISKLVADEPAVFPGSSAGLSRVHFSWRVENDPRTFDYTFNLTCQNINCPPIAQPRLVNSLDLDNLADGTYEWSVTATPVGAGPGASSQIAMATQTLILSHSQNANANFSPPPAIELANETSVTRPLNAPLSSDTALAYSWTSTNAGVTIPNPASPSTNFTIDTALPPAGASTTFSITLTIRKNGNVAATQTKSVTVSRLGVITGIAFDPMAATTVASPGSLPLGILRATVSNPPITLPLVPGNCTFTGGGSISGANYVAPTRQAGAADLQDTVTCGVAAAPAGYALPSSTVTASFTVSVSAPASVAATMVAPSNFQAVNSPVTINVTGVSGISISPDQTSLVVTEQATVSPVSGNAVTFTAPKPGTYTLSGTPIAGHTAPAPKIVRVCGYAGASGGECWVLGGGGESCTQACNVLDNATAGVDMGCVADDPLTQGVDESDWNDDSICTICKAITNSSACAADPNIFAPFDILTSTGVNICYYRQSGSQTCGEIPITQVQGASAKRICKCKL